MAKVVLTKTKLENDYKKYRDNSIFWYIVFLISFALFPFTKGLSFIAFAISGFIASYNMNKARILKAGLKGEKKSIQLFSQLPVSYTIFNNIEIEWEGNRSQLDCLIIGPTGIFVVEVKNHNGKINGVDTDSEWTQYKVGRRGTPYTSKLYNPIKQVNKQVYNLSSYLKKHNIYCWVQGIVFFSNESTIVNLKRTSDKVPVFTYYDEGDRLLSNYIVNFNTHNNRLTESQIESISKILF